MALTRTNRLQQTFGSGGAAHGTGVATTGSFTPSNSSLLVVVVFGMAETDTGMEGTDLTLTDSAGLTWTSRVNSTSSPGWSYGIRVWTAPVTTGVSMTLSADCGAFDMRGYRVEAFDYTDYDTSTPVGATATGTDADGDGAASITLSGSPLTTSETLGFAHIVLTSGTGGVTAGSGFSELFDSGIDGWTRWQSESRTGSTSTTVDWVDLTDTAAAGAGATLVALEIRQTAIPSISGVSPSRFVNGQAGIIISGSTFEAAQGSGQVRISPTDNIADGGIVGQTETAWGDTQITITSVIGGIAEGANAYLFVTNNTGDSNTSGFVVQFIVTGRVAWLRA